MLSRNRRLPLIAFVASFVAFVAVACEEDNTAIPAPVTSTPTATANASSTPTETSTATPTSAEPATATTTAPTGFPVVIEHKFGTTEIEATPERVLTIGFSEQDPVLALAVVPIAVREWFGEQPFATWPWAQDELGDGQPEVLNMAFGELDYEKLAGLAPDVTIATHSGITPEEYAKLAGIAPTVAQPDDYPDFGVPWQEQTVIIGRALGLESDATAAVADVEAAIEAAHLANPAFDDATIAWASDAGDGTYWVVGASTPPMRFLADLGLEMPADLAEAVGDADSLQVSAEQVGMLDTDILIFPVASDEEQAAIENNPVFAQLDVTREGRIIFMRLDDPVYGSLSFSTVLSLPYAVEHLVPELAAVLE